MSMQFKNLEDIERYVRHNMPGWTISRGKETSMLKSMISPSEDYEVLRLFRPGEKDISFAEFWQGYYKAFPDEYVGFCGHFNCQGSLDFAMKDVIAEKNRLEMCPKIINAVNTAVQLDACLRKVYKPISRDSIVVMRSESGIVWVVNCEKFRCNVRQRCIMTVKEVENGGFCVEYQLETFKNGKYQLDTYNSINV